MAYTHHAAKADAYDRSGFGAKALSHRNRAAFHRRAASFGTKDAGSEELSLDKLSLDEPRAGKSVPSGLSAEELRILDLPPSERESCDECGEPPRDGTTLMRSDRNFEDMVCLKCWQANGLRQDRLIDSFRDENARRAAHYLGGDGSGRRPQE